MKNKTKKELVEALELLLNEDNKVVAAKSPHNVMSIKKAQEVLKRAKKEIAEDTPVKDIKGETHYVDIPQADTEEWLNIESFTKRKDALKFAQEKFGADENGMVSLLARS